MTTIQRKRLEQLAKYHETKVPRKGFNMGNFGHCAAHHACTLFKKAGFRKEDSPCLCAVPIYRGCVASSAISLFFGWEAVESGLFSASNPAMTPKQWAKYCRAFLANTQ